MPELIKIQNWRISNKCKCGKGRTHLHERETEEESALLWLQERTVYHCLRVECVGTHNGTSTNHRVSQHYVHSVQEMKVTHRLQVVLISALEHSFEQLSSLNHWQDTRLVSEGDPTGKHKAPCHFSFCYIDFLAVLEPAWLTGRQSISHTQ